ncbi:hypothetical protein FA13DRAFT_1819594 [Coprinellus micaceus]|uniref:Uncharacterized protein n=1 Tax=Coprinellus micaceus TaxID=71717 RepID=A0A4Y7SHJ1_COPMI|nr:hypothetical protein FA13DRAFT_1819594 [Coprinellus micaceus]
MRVTEEKGALGLPWRRRKLPFWVLWRAPRRWRFCTMTCVSSDGGHRNCQVSQWSSKVDGVLTAIGGACAGLEYSPSGRLIEELPNDQEEGSEAQYTS